jgi:hypothetical protein
VLDALAQDGRGLLFFWPLSAARYHFLWRPIPDAPMGGEIFTRLGLEHILTEIVYFLPLTLFAARPLLVGGFREMRSRRPPRPAPAPRPAP